MAQNGSRNPREESADVVVIGGGPAGSTAATLLKQARPDWRIVICEREEFPRHHIGESLLPNANPILAKLGVVDRLDEQGFVRKGGVTVKLREGHPMIREWFIYDTERHLHGAEQETKIPHHAWHVERSRYDQILLDHAADCGVELVQPASAVEVLKDGERVTGLVVEDAEGRRSFSSRFLIDCSGQARFVGRSLGLDILEHNLGDLAIYRYYEGADWTEDFLGTPDYAKVFLAVAPPCAWVWYIVLSPTRVSVGVVTRKNTVLGKDVDAVFDETVERVPEMAWLLRNARRAPASGEKVATTRTQTAANWSYAHQRAAGPGWYLAGDAAAFVDPVLSSGVMLAHYAGLWVANAIMTECDHPEVDVKELHDGYRELYEEARAGFGDMAAWWYSQSDSNMDETWVEHGAKLMHARNVRGAENMSDVEAFMSLVAGRLTDFRFRFVGVGGFEPKGMADVGGGSYGTDLVDKIFGVFEATAALERNWDRYERDWYVGTYVEANYWWRLPLIRFFRDGEPIEYRPAVHFLPNGDPDIERSVQTLDALLAGIETAELFGDLEWELHRRQTDIEDDAVKSQMACEMIQDMIRLELLRAGAEGGKLRARTYERIDDMDVLERAYESVETNEVEIGSYSDPNARMSVCSYTVAGRERRYAPPAGALPAIEAALAACDGRRPVASIVGEMHDAAADTGVDTLVDVLTELVQLGVLQVAGQSDGRRPFPADADRAIVSAVAGATNGDWNVAESYSLKGEIHVQLETPEGPLPLAMATTARVPRGYTSHDGVSYWYPLESGAAEPSRETLEHLDRVISRLRTVIPPILHRVLEESL